MARAYPSRSSRRGVYRHPFPLASVRQARRTPLPSVLVARPTIVRRHYRAHRRPIVRARPFHAASVAVAQRHHRTLHLRGFPSVTGGEILIRQGGVFVSTPLLVRSGGTFTETPLLRRSGGIFAPT